MVIRNATKGFAAARKPHRRKDLNTIAGDKADIEEKGKTVI